MFAVCVRLTIKDGVWAEFMTHMLTNAETSLEAEADCHRFDVLTDPANPNGVFLYELYRNAAAFEHHLQSPHFKAFDDITAPMIATKTVETWLEVRP